MYACFQALSSKLARQFLEDQRLFTRTVKYPPRSKGREVDGRMVEGWGEANMTLLSLASQKSRDQECADRRMHQPVPGKSYNVNEVLLLGIETDERIRIGRGAVKPACCRDQAPGVGKQWRKLLNLCQDGIPIVIDAVVMAKWRINAILVGIIKLRLRL